MAKALKYVSSTGEVVDLREYKWQIYKTNLHNYSWKPIENSNNYGTNITGFSKDPLSLELQIAIRGSHDDKAERLNHLTAVAEQDVVSLQEGRLYFGDMYINCFIIASNTEPQTNKNYTLRIWNIYAPYPFWMTETNKSFLHGKQYIGDGDNYNYGYEYDYSSTATGVQYWNLEHYAPSDFIMTIYGEVTEPTITIGGHEYKVFTEIGRGERVVINSRAKTITKYLRNGTTENLFDLRAKASDIFHKLPIGNTKYVWNGLFDYDMTALIERSEPKW